MEKPACGCAPAEAVGEKIEAVYEAETPQEGASETVSEASPACLPWVKVTRDPERFRACMTSARERGPITTSKEVYDLIKDHMTGEDQEVFYVILLDTQRQLRGIAEIARGARDHTIVPPPDVLRVVIVSGATAFIVAHNHPSGKETPSAADKRLTKHIEELAHSMGIPLFDHIVVGSHGYYSFADNNQIRKVFGK